MQLKLTVSSVQAQSLGSEATVFYRLRGGTIGRARDNDWILPDPERVVSSHHARVLYDRGSYFVEDTSTNGTYLNQFDEPMPKGQPVPLTHGDTLYIGDYEIQVELTEEALHSPPAGPHDHPTESDETDFIAEPYTPQIGARSASQHDDGWASAPSVDNDPWKAQDYPPPGTQDLNGPSSQSDHLPADQQHFRPPAAAPELIPQDVLSPVSETLPDDWWSTDEESAAAASMTPPQILGQPSSPQSPQVVQQPPPVPEDTSPPMMEPDTTPSPMEDIPPSVPGSLPAWEQHPPSSVISSPTLEPDTTPSPMEEMKPAPFEPLSVQERKQRPPVSGVASSPTPQLGTAPVPDKAPSHPAANSAETAQLIDVFFTGLGVDPAEVSPAQREALFHQIGRLMRLLTQATIEVLQARSTLKGEFRLSQTIVRPAENNPLKFSLSADQALQQFFVERRPGFMEPEAAFAEALKDIKQHELAVVAGMRAAFDCLLRKLAPETVESALKATGKRSSMLFGPKPWDYYKVYYSEFKANAGDDFQGIFGEDFVRAYEEQIAQLATRGRGQ